jgi:hypothetical protein
MGRWNSKSKYDARWKPNELIGKWIVIDGTVHTHNGYAQILCKCSCGITSAKLIDAHSLHSGHSTQCTKCGFSRKQKNNPSWRGHEDIPAALITRIRCNAKKRNIEFVLSPEHLWDLYERQNKLCALTLLPISFENHTASLDRIDSSKGYTADNVQWVHKSINIMKNGFSQDYFLTLCHEIAKSNKNPAADLTKEDYFKFGRNKNEGN